MRASRILAMSSIAAGIGAAAAVSRSGDRAGKSFYERAAPEPTVRDVLGMRIRLPVVYHRAEGFWALFPADPDRVREALSSADLHPVRTLDGRATVGIGAFRYHEVTVQLEDGRTAILEPYGEVFMGPLVTRRAAPPMIEALPAVGTVFGLGLDIIHLAVTTREARDGGLALWGLPKVVADMEFEDSVVERSVRVGESGEQILTLAVTAGGRETIERSPNVLFGVLDGRLIEVTARGISRVQQQMGPTGARLELGPHPVADSLRRLGVDYRPIASVTELQSRFYLGSGRPLGPAVAHAPFPAADRERGRYVVRHPNTDWIDQYASRPAGVRHERVAGHPIERASEPAATV